MYRVEWLQSAVNDLAAIWNRADPAQRDRITAASNVVDLRLSRDGAHEGESRPDGSRIMFVAPRAVKFLPESDGRTVTVLQVRSFGKRKR